MSERRAESGFPAAVFQDLVGDHEDQHGGADVVGQGAGVDEAEGEIVHVAHGDDLVEKRAEAVRIFLGKIHQEGAGQEVEKDQSIAEDGGDDLEFAATVRVVRKDDLHNAMEQPGL